ncbi:MAG: CBS domain-containing protein [Oxalobacteraceae bacterium]|nr:MAG: CBS domain-containing protein [Oxalobacteraceae bacterium]
MSVKQILEEKGHDVFTLSDSATLGDAAKALATRRIGALILLDAEGKLAGILSERDVVRMIGTTGPDCLTQGVADVMTRTVTTCGENATVNEVMELMTNGRFRHIPVVERGKLIGLISIGDLVKRRIEDAEREAEDMRTYIAAAG